MEVGDGGGEEASEGVEGEGNEGEASDDVEWRETRDGCRDPRRWEDGEHEVAAQAPEDQAW